MTVIHQPTPASFECSNYKTCKHFYNKEMCARCFYNFKAVSPKGYYLKRKRGI